MFHPPDVYASGGESRGFIRFFNGAMDFIIVHEEGAVESFFFSLFSENDSSCRQKPCLSGPRTRRRFLCSISAAGAGDSALQIPSGVTVTLDLNGYTLNRNRSSGDGLGHILLAHEGATLTLKDSRGGGTLTGGWANDGGAIYNSPPRRSITWASNGPSSTRPIWIGCSPP